MKRFKPESSIATFFGIGRLPFIPGTFGSYAAIMLVSYLFFQPHMVEMEDKKYLDYGPVIIDPNYIVHVLILISAFLYIIGVWASERHARIEGEKDPKCIVIDEVAGIFTSCSLVALVYSFLLTFYEKDFILYLVKASWFFPVIFVLFRAFDMLKPWHIGRADRKYTGGFGIMIDDQIAALYTAVSFYIMLFSLKYMGILDKLIEAGTLDHYTKTIMFLLLWPFYLLMDPRGVIAVFS